MHDSFNDHLAWPGKLDLNARTPQAVRDKLMAMGYIITVKKYTSGPINAIFFDQAHGTFWGGSSNYGEDYGIAW
jgi:gamma-glutamyltranspeptidase/glutathione hydrolase